MCVCNVIFPSGLAIIRLEPVHFDVLECWGFSAGIDTCVAENKVKCKKVRTTVVYCCLISK